MSLFVSFRFCIMSRFKCSEIYYLQQNTNPIFDANQDVKIKSRSGDEVNFNRLFLVAFSPIFKSIFSILNDSESNLTIITEFDQKEVEILSKFCTQGILPLPLNELAKEIPYEIVKVFSGFGIDLYNILFKKKDQDETFKKEDITGKNLLIHFIPK